MQLYFHSVKDDMLQIKPDRATQGLIFQCGADNAFPSLVEALIKLSVTSKNCVGKVAKAIYGKAFGPLGQVVVNSLGQTLNEVLRVAAREYAKHNNVFIHIGYNGEFKINSIKVIPFTKVRKGKADDRGYSGKFLIYNNWDKTLSKKVNLENATIVDKYNPREAVIASQITTAGSIGQYNGQMLQIQEDANAIYSLTDLNSVLSEALLESNSKEFRMRGSTTGFLNTKLLTVKPFANDEDRRKFKNTLNDLQGSENTGSVLLLEASQMTDELDKQFKLDDLSSNYNDKLFEYSDSQAEKNICKAFEVPLLLVNPADAGIYNNSGEIHKEAKRQLWENNEEERDMLEGTFASLMLNFEKPVEGLKIINPYQTQA